MMSILLAKYIVEKKETHMKYLILTTILLSNLAYAHNDGDYHNKHHDGRYSDPYHDDRNYKHHDDNNNIRHDHDGRHDHDNQRDDIHFGKYHDRYYHSYDKCWDKNKYNKSRYNRCVYRELKHGGYNSFRQFKYNGFISDDDVKIIIDFNKDY